jgi:hypothetical protein
MELPISTDKLNIILIGEASPVLVYGTSDHKKDRDGKLLYKIPVLIQGTDNRQDPITSITYGGEKLSVPNGTRLNVKDLTILTWSIRSTNGQLRSGTTLKAKSITAMGNRN